MLVNSVLKAKEIPQTPPDVARRVHHAEFDALRALIESLSPDDWERATDCTRWNVREMIAHLVGSADEALHPWMFVRHWIFGPKRRYPQLSQLDAANECQIDDRRDWSGERIAAELVRLGPPAIDKIGRKWMRRLRVPKSQELLAGAPLTYMFDVIAIRDTWMHRLDAARATGRDFVVGEHDAEVVAQVIRDLGLTWDGPSIILELTGPAGGRWRLGDGEPVDTVSVDAVQYMRLLSGRPAEPAVGASDPAATEAVRRARVVF